jgi:uracil-DNA glycosylase
MRVVIVGHSPGKVSESKSITRIKVKRWLGETQYDWYNLVDYHTASLKMKEITLKAEQLIGYDKVIALGNQPSDWLIRNGVNHLKVPHPSGLNRVWNDPGAEPQTINLIKSYLETKDIYTV